MQKKGFCNSKIAKVENIKNERETFTMKIVGIGKCQYEEQHIMKIEKISIRKGKKAGGWERMLSENKL